MYVIFRFVLTEAECEDGKYKFHSTLVWCLARQVPLSVMIRFTELQSGPKCTDNAENLTEHSVANSSMYDTYFFTFMASTILEN
jgi:hypothetical protein